MIHIVGLSGKARCIKAIQGLAKVVFLCTIFLGGIVKRDENAVILQNVSHHLSGEEQTNKVKGKWWF